MRHTLLTGLLLVPLALAAPAFASRSAVDVMNSTHGLAVSTGVIHAKILSHANDIYVPAVSQFSWFPSPAQVDLKLEVSKKGRAQDIQILSSDDPFLNAPVVAAVRQFRWRPAKLDHRTIPIDLNLRVRVHL